MIFDKKIIKAIFLTRPNRFEAYVYMGGKEVLVHIPNTGRCSEILIPKVQVLLREENNPRRKTKYDLIAAYKNGKLINIDSQIPNKVVYEALNKGKIEYFKKYNKIEKEKTFGNSRFDFKLSNFENQECYLEVKGVTLEHDEVTSFPDAPTERGKKHLMELVEVKKSGREAGILFLIQMQDVRYFTPYDEMDEEFGQALRYAQREGVCVSAYNCNVGESFIELDREIQIKL
ncbi:DNA/RNA nuclease SfsA [Clostridium tyrobutyricum]|uniref:DNA/RNA nuclease SfsA n=1 Tax=Clostridium tyrobutyricum TaxID=1519 RepID=UPI0011C858EE|nr:DNA/RNA nuclease SfsA [Clostridium tyrobutyricum]